MRIARGAMIGAEARASGFNIMLAGSVNLVREPRNGRNFEYAGEDPLLAGVMVGAQIKGIESNHIISTIKHFALNDQETDRNTLNVNIDRAQARMSDLLAFQIAIEQSNPGSVMCSYNRVWGDHACESAYLLTDVLRHGLGLERLRDVGLGRNPQHCQGRDGRARPAVGLPFDDQPYFGALLLKAVAGGELKETRLDEMARRIVRTLFAKGVIDYPVKITPIDLKAHAHVTRAGAEQGAVLLKNDGGLLPLAKRTARIAIIGGYADKGVLAGGGSSLVYPAGGNAVPDLEPKVWPGPIMYYPSSPLRAVQALAPGAKVVFDSGSNRDSAAKLAAGSDVALVFVTQWTGESADKSLTLPDGQDELVSAVAAANPRTVVVIEAGGAVFMPWLEKVPAVLHAWYPGTAGGEAIANILFGVVNPSGHLPISLPKDESQFARVVLEDKDAQGKKTLEVNYAEGATVGYKWFDAHDQKPLFAFGHGLSYTRFTYSNLQARLDGQDLVVKFQVRNTGRRDGKDVAQLYVSPLAGGWEAPKRLAGFKKVELQPGVTEPVELRVDPRLLAVFSEADKTWRIAPGNYKLMLGHSSADVQLETAIELPARSLPVRPKT